VLVAARYEGKVTPARAEFQADLHAYAFQEQAAPLTLPFGGSDLQEVQLDGQPAYPVTLAPPQAGYSVRVKGRGLHKVQLRFSVALPETTEDLELRCIIPELALSHLQLTLPASASYASALFCKGGQHVEVDGAGVHVEADLGRVNMLQVRWRQERIPPQPAA